MEIYEEKSMFGDGVSLSWISNIGHYISVFCYCLQPTKLAVTVRSPRPPSSGANLILYATCTLRFP